MCWPSAILANYGLGQLLTILPLGSLPRPPDPRVAPWLEFARPLRGAWLCGGFIFRLCPSFGLVWLAATRAAAGAECVATTL